MEIPASIERRLPWDGSHNTRDLGGYATSAGMLTQSRRFVRSDTLQHLSLEGQAALVAYGVRTIVDLRLPVELTSGPNPFAASNSHGILYFNRSLIDSFRSQEDDGTATGLADHYRDNLTSSNGRIAAILETLAEAGEGTVLFHCQGGQDRTGLISAFLLGIAGVPDATIVADYLLTADLLGPANAAFLENGPGERDERERILAFFTPTAAAMRDTIAFLDREYGGFAGYLRQDGVPQSTIGALRARLLD